MRSPERGGTLLLVPVLIVVVRVDLEAGNLDQCASMAFIDVVVEGPVLNVHERLFAGTEKDEPTRFRARVTD